MKISEMITNLQEFMAKNGDLDCWYASDDEGNSFHKVYYSPSLFYHNLDNDEMHDCIEEFGGYKDDIHPVCIVN